METQDATKPTEELLIPEQLETLVKMIEEKPEALATGNEDLRKAALNATKYVYDLGECLNYLWLVCKLTHQVALRTEKDACSRVNDLLTSISPSYAPQTRSQAADSSRKRKRGSQSPPPPDKAAPLLRETPLTELIVDGMSDEQVWAELELRAHNVCDILNHALDGPIPGRESGEEEEDESGDEEEEEHELKKMRQALLDEGFDPDELDGMGFDEDDEEDEEDSEDDQSGESDEYGAGDGEVELSELVEELRDPSDEDDEDGNDLEVGAPSLLSGGKRTLKLKLRRGGHPVLDDGFFDLAAFNAEIEAAESKSVSKGRLSKDDEDEDDDEDDAELVDLFAPVDDTAAFDEEDIEQGGGMPSHLLPSTSIHTSLQISSTKTSSNHRSGFRHRKQRNGLKVLLMNHLPQLERFASTRRSESGRSRRKGRIFRFLLCSTKRTTTMTTMNTWTTTATTTRKTWTRMKRC